jgi:hypothetical protein
LILDQFEDLFATPALWEAREPLFNDLAGAIDANPALRAVISLRSDYLANLVPYQRLLPGAGATRYQLESLKAAGARTAISRPFASTGLPLDPTAVDQLVTSLLERQSDAGRTVAGQYVNTVELQIVCRRLWDELRQLNPSGPDSAGDRPSGLLLPDGFDMEDAVVKFVDATLKDACGSSRSAEVSVRRWLQSEMMSDGRRNFHRRGANTTAGMTNTIVDKLEEGRLLQFEDRNGEPWVELTHDRLVPAIIRSNEQWRAAARPTDEKSRVAGALAISVVFMLTMFALLRKPVEPSELIASGVVSEADVESALARPPAEAIVIAVEDGVAEVRLRKVDDGGEPITETATAVSDDEPLARWVEPGQEYEITADQPAAADEESFTFFRVLTADVVPHDALVDGARSDGATELDVEHTYVVLDLRPGEAYLVESSDSIGSVGGAAVPWQDSDSALIDTGARGRRSADARVPVAIEVGGGGGSLAISPVTMHALGLPVPGVPADIPERRAVGFEFEIPDATNAVAISVLCDDVFGDLVVARSTGAPVSPAVELAQGEGVSRTTEIVPVDAGAYRLYLVNEYEHQCSVFATPTNLPTLVGPGRVTMRLSGGDEVTALSLDGSEDSVVWTSPEKHADTTLRCADVEAAVIPGNDRLVGALAAGDRCVVMLRRADEDGNRSISVDVSVIALEPAPVPDD